VSVCWQCCVFLGRRMCFGLVTQSRWALLRVVCLCVIMKPRQWGFPGPWWWQKRSKLVGNSQYVIKHILYMCICWSEDMSWNVTFIFI